MAARGEAQADVEVSTLVVPAWRLRWRAPELALVLGERAVALASTRRDEVDRLRAEALVVFASNRMGRGVKTADRALDALKAAEAAAQHETAWRLRVELADSARSVGAPLTGFAAVRPVLEADGVPAGLRAGALVQAAECLVSVGRGPALGRALDEADRLYQADPMLDHDTTLLHRGLLRAVAAGRHRRWGDLAAAVEACREGLSFLAGLQDPESDNGQVSGRLSVELVCALLDSGKPGEASEVGTPLLERPVRAPSATAAGWLRLALATRVHLPAGRVALARDLLRDVADSAERHQLDTLLAESLLALAHVHEVAGNLTDALTDLRSAHAAERRRARAVYAVRARLAAEFSGVHRHPAGGLHDDLIALLDAGSTAATTAPPAAPADANLTPEARQQLRQWRPVQVHRNEGMRVKRSRRAAEDMTVDGISAARAHAADRWRLIQPFGTDEPERTPSPSAPTTDAPATGTQAADGPAGSAPGPDVPVANAPDTNAPDTNAPGSGTSGGGGSPAAPQDHVHQVAAPRINTPQTAASQTGAFPPAAPIGAAPIPAAPIPAAPISAGPIPAAQASAAQASAEQPPAGQSPAGQPPAERSPFGQQFVSRPPGNPPQFGNAPQAEQPGGRRRAPDPPPQQSTQGRPEHARSGQARPIAPTTLSQPPTPPGGLAQSPTTPPGDRLPGALPGMPLPVFPTPPVPPASAASPTPPVFPSAPEVPAGLDSSPMPSAESRPRVEPESVVEKTALIPRIPAGPEPTSEPTSQPVVEAGALDAAGEDGEQERSVPAAGLIAAAGAMRSGRRRAREASEDEEAERDAGESNVLDNLKAAGLLDPQRAGGRRRAPETGAAETGAAETGAAEAEAAQVEAPEAPGTPEVAEVVRAVGAPEGETVKWKVEAPARLRADEPAAEPVADEPAADESAADEPVVDEPVFDAPVVDVDMFDSPTMVQPAIRDDVPPVGLGAAFVKGPLIPTARVPDPPDFPASAMDAFPMPPLVADPSRDDVSVAPVPSSHEPATGTFPAGGATHSAAPQNSWSGAVERDAVAPSATPDEPVGADAVVESDRSVALGHHRPQPDPVHEPEPDLEPNPESDLEPVREPEPVTPPAPEPDTTPSVPEPSQVPPVPEPDQVPPVPVPEPVPPKPSPSGFLGAADVEDEEPEQPFVTSVVVGGRTIDLPAVVQPPVLESPSATRAARAARRPKSDLTLAELLAEALVAYEDARREGDGFPDDEMDEDTAPVRTQATHSPPTHSPPAHSPPVEPPQAERLPVGPPPIAPPGVEPVPDNETTAPIRRLDAPPFDTWTLPES
ncbi:hypothetical protein ACFFSW_08065 [Saccharothrix longispora]|uniref:Uncharacterized protein n=1 Tax=Saccharothrix longispora TaxID=33920 RepID=A0ABU1Q6R8_9PSEU|nr:hypothetical protein [Saccharothrix longispora]MDR6598595.1 hypothetical protein [Saccharothrix longispora]